MEAIIVTLIILFFIHLSNINKNFNKLKELLTDAINLNTTQRQQLRDLEDESEKKLLNQTKNIKKQINIILKKIEDKKPPKKSYFKERHYLNQKKHFLLPHATISPAAIIEALQYSLWDEEKTEEIIKKRFFIWFSEILFDKKINILDFKILKDSGGYDFPDGFGIVFYYALDEKNSYKGTLSASLKDDTVFHTEIKSDDWDDKDDYHFQSLFSFFEDNYETIENINSEIFCNYQVWEKRIVKDKKYIIISLTDYLDFLSENSAVYANINIKNYFMKEEEELDFFKNIEIRNLEWSPNKEIGKIDIFKEKLEFFKKIVLESQDGSPRLRYKLALYYIFGLLKDADKDADRYEGVRILNQLSDENYNYADLVLGILYIDGYLVLKNPSRAKQHIEKAFDAGLEIAKTVWNDNKLWEQDYT